MQKFRILTREEVLNKKFSFLRKNGLIAKATDLYYLLGGKDVYNSKEEVEQTTEENLKNRLGCYWINNVETSEPDSITNDEKINSQVKATDISIGCRPMIKYSEIKSESHEQKSEDDVLTITYGEYPQYPVSKNLKEQLESLEEKGELSKTGKKYTMYISDSNAEYSYEKKFAEYEYKGKKYVRFEYIPTIPPSYLSNKEKLWFYSIHWFEVQPVSWLVDVEKDTAITEKVLFSGVAYYDEDDMYFEECEDDTWIEYKYETSTLNRHLNENFAKDIIPSKTKNKCSVSDVVNGNYNQQELQQLPLSEKRKVLTSLEKEVIEILDKLRVFANDLDPEFGKIFDKKMQYEVKKTKESLDQPVKAKRK